MAPVAETDRVEAWLAPRWRRLLEFMAGFASAPTDVAELRERVEYLEDSLAASDARAERNEDALRPWDEVRR